MLKLRGWSKKTAFLIIGLVLISLIGASILYVNPATKHFIVKLTEGVPFIDAGEVSAECSVNSVENASRLEPGDAIAVRCLLRNSTKKQFEGLAVSTGLERNKVHYLRDIKGATALNDESVSIVFENISSAPKSMVELEFKANANFSDTNYLLSINPKILNEKIQIGEGGKMTREVVANKDSGGQPIQVKRSVGE